jgi:tetratricopeptide (TPR) repeat protein
MKTKTLCRSVLLVAVVLPAPAALAHTEREVEKTCPLCKEKFKCVLDMSGTQFGMRLDLKPIGPIAAPWRVPVCPKCHLVIYDDDKIPDAELAKCKAIVESDEYKKHTARASYFLMGLLREGLEKDSLGTAHVFLRASWQEEGDKKLHAEDLERSLMHFEAYLKKEPQPKPAAKEGEEKDNSHETAQLMKGEILRRLGRFDEATRHLTEIEKTKEFQKGILANIVKYELRLCGEKDSRPHDVSDARSKSEPTEEAADKPDEENEKK